MKSLRNHPGVWLTIAIAITLVALNALFPAVGGDPLQVLGLSTGLGGSGLGLAALGMALGEVRMERKSGDGGGEPSLKELITAQASAWEQFKKANDARLAEVEKKGHASADAVEQVAKINADLTQISAQIKAITERSDELEKKLGRPGAGGRDGGLTPEQQEHKSALGQYLRKGVEGDLRSLERKALSSQSDPDGGFLVDPEMDASIDRVAAAVTTIASVARQVTVGSNEYKRLVKTRGVSGGWIGESEDSAETNAPQYSEISLAVAKVYAEPWVPNDLLEDAGYDLEADLADEAGITFGETEGNAFINGTGVKQPMGMLSYTMVANASYAWGKLGYTATGVSGDFAASNKADKVVDLMHSLKQIYRPGAVFLMADATLAIMRQFKDGSGSYYLWNPDPATGPSGSFLGARVVVDDYMPVLAANSYSVAYGNFQRGYTVARRRGIAVIRDNVTKKGTTKFNFTRRVAGGVTNFEAIKLLKFGTS